MIIEHHPAVIAHADSIIDLGPGGGRDDGRVVFDRQARRDRRYALDPDR